MLCEVCFRFPVAFANMFAIRLFQMVFVFVRFGHLTTHIRMKPKKIELQAAISFLPIDMLRMNIYFIEYSPYCCAVIVENAKSNFMSRNFVCHRKTSSKAALRCNRFYRNYNLLTDMKSSTLNGKWNGFCEWSFSC